MFAFIGALFGLIIGSFLNVVILRHGVRSVGGRSSCMHCGHQLEVGDLVPVFSWVFLRGRCRYCGSPISAQYPLVEAMTALLFAVLFGAVPSVLHLVAGVVIIGLVIAITVYDTYHTIIPNAWAYLFALAAFCYHAPEFVHAPSMILTYAIAGAAGAVAPLLALWFISRGRWMGFGDVKLALGIGFLLGFPQGFIAIMCSFMIGTVIMLPLLALGRLMPAPLTHTSSFSLAHLRLTMKSEVPFGPFLIASCLLFWFLQLYGVPFSLAWLAL